MKWRDLAYDQATWEHENADIPDLKKAIEYYWVNLESIIKYCHLL